MQSNPEAFRTSCTVNANVPCFVICGPWEEAHVQGQNISLWSLAGETSHKRLGNNSAHQTLGSGPVSALDSLKHTLPGPLKSTFAQQDRGGQLSSACTAILQPTPQVSSHQILVLSILTACTLQLVPLSIKVPQSCPSCMQYVTMSMSSIKPNLPWPLRTAQPHVTCVCPMKKASLHLMSQNAGPSMAQHWDIQSRCSCRKAQQHRACVTIKKRLGLAWLAGPE